MEPDSTDVSAVPVFVFGTDCPEFIHQSVTDAKGKEEKRRTGDFAVGAGRLHPVNLKWVLAAVAGLVLFCSGVVSGIWLVESRQQGGLQQTKSDEEREGFQFLVHNMAMNNGNITNSNPPNTLYSNYMNAGTNSYAEITDLYQLYGISGGREIEKIVYSRGTQGEQAARRTITEETVLEEFYRLTSGLVRCNTDTFFNKVIDVMSEQEIAAFHEECMLFEITGTNGLVFTYNIYPKSGWLYCAGTMSYYVLSQELLDWYEKNCGE